MPDIVVISDTEEIIDEEEDDGIAFIGQSSGPPRIAEAGPSRSAPIFIGSDDDDQDIHAFIASTLTDGSTSRRSTSAVRTKTVVDVDVEVEAVRAVKAGKGKQRELEDERSFADLAAEFDKFESDLLSRLDSLTNTKSSLLLDSAQTEAEGERSIQPELEKEKRPKKKRKSSAAGDIGDLSEGGKGKRQKDDSGQKLTKEEKEALKAQEKAEKQLARDTAKAAKEAERSYQRKLAEVNRLRTSKNDTVREIHLYLSSDLADPTGPLSGALPEIKKRVADNLSELHFLPPDESPIPGVIRFKRHLKARWDASKKQFIPLDVYKWVWESTILLIVNAEEVVDMISAGGDTLSTWASDVRLNLGLGEKDQMIIMIKGLQKYYSKSKSLANKEFTAAARAGLDGRTTSTSSVGISARVDKETVEREMVKLQVTERCFLVHVEKTEDIEDWVFNTAADVAIRPYKLLSKSHLNFCAADGVKKKSSNPTEACELMLQEVTGITPSAAMGIAAEYPTFRELMGAFERAERRGGAERGELMLQDCQIKTLRNGTANGRKLNKALAKRVYNVFRGDDSLALV